MIDARTIQITTYTHKDENNKWLVKPYNDEIKPDEEDVVLVKHGDLIRLEHIQTKRNLHTHKEQAPLTKKHYQVTGYGEVNDRNLFIFIFIVLFFALSHPHPTVISNCSHLHEILFLRVAFSKWRFAFPFKFFSLVNGVVARSIRCAYLI